ncbi:hypothetical protein IFR05_003798 [Cadophora sp. M221]|nr:hypothetical protein IFR05_003798 [Cadophora sp. M221]
MAQAIDGNCLDEFGCWAWEKARVCISLLLCQSPLHPYPALCDDLDQQLLNPNAVEKLIALLQELLSTIIEMNNSQLVGLKRCFNIAARVGFGIQRDLRPWRFSFVPSGTGEVGLNDKASLVSRNCAPFRITECGDQEDFASNKQVTLFPALIALGDESVLRHYAPAVILPAEFARWK